MRHVVNGTPVVLGGALIVPAGLMSTLRGDEPQDPVAAMFATDAAVRKRIQMLAMNAVCCVVKRVAATLLTSRPRNAGGTSRCTRQPSTT